MTDRAAPARPSAGAAGSPCPVPTDRPAMLDRAPLPRTLLPDGWPKPKGYANGMEARGRLVFVGGQVGWTREMRFEARDLPGQIRQTLLNVVAVLAEAGAGPEHVTSMTWYLLDRRDYGARLKEIGAVWREVMGRNFPAMAVVEVSGLVEDEALVEIQATAVVPD